MLTIFFLHSFNKIFHTLFRQKYQRNNARKTVYTKIASYQVNPIAPTVPPEGRLYNPTSH